MAKRIHINKEDYLKGLKDAVQNIQDAVDKMEHKSVQGLAKALMFVGAESQNKAPVDTGDLRGSLEIDIDDTMIAKGISGGGIDEISDVPENGRVGTISYNTPYAANQHEHTEYDHPLGGQAKYLESVMINEKDRIVAIIADSIMEGWEE